MWYNVIGDVMLYDINIKTILLMIAIPLIFVALIIPLVKKYVEENKK